MRRLPYGSPQKINKYCGLVGQDLAFLNKGDSFEILRPSTGELGTLEYLSDTKVFQRVKPLSGIQGEYLSHGLEQYGPSFISLYDFERGAIKYNTNSIK